MSRYRRKKHLGDISREIQVHESSLQTSCCCLLLARLTLEGRVDRDGLCGKIVGIASGFNFRFQGLDPSSSTRSLALSSKQSASKCSEQRRGFFGRDFLPTACVQARRNFSFLGNM